MNCRTFFARHQLWVFSFVLATAVFLTFGGALKNGFVNYDDPDYVTQNPHVRAGLTWSNFRWAFITDHAGNWHPVTWLSHMLDCQLFGLNPAGHHFASVLFHAIAVVLLFIAFNEMTAATGRSFFIAALFALHPLRVESVAWACERKDVLATFFWMLTLWLYGRWCKDSFRRKSFSSAYYAAAIGTFALGLMSKSMLVTLPAVLLLLDYWPLRRWRQPDGNLNTKRLLVEKLPFFLLTALASVWTLLIQHRIGAVKTFATYPTGARVGNALVSYCRYLLKIFYPTSLAAFYPHPIYWPRGIVIVSTGVLICASFLTIYHRRRYPYLFVGWFWYLLAALPVIGLIQVGAQSMADRYTYIPSVGVFVCVSWGIQSVFERLNWPMQLLRMTSAAAVACCALMTIRQVSFWHDSQTLFRHAIEVTAANPVACMNLGISLMDDGLTAEGMAQLRAAVGLAPYYSEAHLTLATALERTGKYEEGLSELDEALRQNPESAKAYLEAGVISQRMGRLFDAIAFFRQAVRRQPDYADAHNDLGVVLEQTGQISEALIEYKVALHFDPEHADAHQNLGALYYKQDDIVGAVIEFARVVKIKPMSAIAENNLGSALLVQGKLDEATSHFRAALRLKPDFPSAQANLNAATEQKKAMLVQ